MSMCCLCRACRATRIGLERSLSGNWRKEPGHVPDELSIRLIITDTGPLITLAAADSLDYLLYPGVPVFFSEGLAKAGLPDQGDSQQ